MKIKKSIEIIIKSREILLLKIWTTLLTFAFARLTRMDCRIICHSSTINSCVFLAFDSLTIAQRFQYGLGLDHSFDGHSNFLEILLEKDLGCVLGVVVANYYQESCCMYTKNLHI